LAQQILADIREQLFSCQQASMQQHVRLLALRHAFPWNSAVGEHVAAQ
jgi:hypothetical protein